MHQLPSLPYEYNALEPHIDEATMRLHHGKHHRGYVDKLNAALEKYPVWQEKTLDELLLNLKALPEEIKETIANNGGGHYNHSLFWTLLAPAAGSMSGPGALILKLLEKDFTSLENFKRIFTETALKVFGSGWVWLVKDGAQKLVVISLPNQTTPITYGQPILGLDVWEHAYYLKYQNRRADYITAFWSVVNWREVEKRLTS